MSGKTSAFLLLAAAALGAILALGHRTQPLPERIQASVEGTFVAQGIVPSRLRSPDGARFWSSWQDDDANTGRLRLGPLVAPAVLGLYVAGYPQRAGGGLELENLVTGERWKPATADPGEAWNPVVVRLPPHWVGDSITLHAVDHSAEVFGWLAVAEPFVPAWGPEWWHGFVRLLVIFIFVGLIVLLALTGAGEICRNLGVFPIWLLPLAAGGLLTLSGYGVFWLAFLHSSLGLVGAWIELVAAAGAAFLFGPASGSVWRERDWRIAVGLMAGVGLFFVAVMLLFDREEPVSMVAQTRFAERLPEDNLVPQRLAERLVQGLSPKHIAGGWRSSDRPPLQAGWVLLVTRPVRALGVDYDSSAQMAGIWFQLLWIPGVWSWLRRVGAPVGVGVAVIVSLVPTGFLFLNTGFVWPKLGAAALVLGAVVYGLGQMGCRRPPWHAYVPGAMLAALGWLAHGGVAFAFVALIPFAVWFCCRSGRLRAGGVALLAAFVLCSPWLAYQRWYEPPGNQLVRWHLAGQQNPDKVGTLKSLAAAYRDLTLVDWAQSRAENIRQTVRGNWRALVTFDWSDLAARRGDESFLFRAMGWWNLGFVAWLATMLVSRRRVDGRGRDRNAYRLSMLWALLTVIVWNGLMFVGGSTLIHQGSYTVLLILLPGLALALWRFHPLAFAVVALLQTLNFCVLWLRAPGHWEAGERSFGATMVVGLAAAGLIAAAWACLAQEWLGWRTAAKGGA